MEYAAPLHLLYMAHKLFITGSVLFILLSSVSLFLPNVVIHEEHFVPIPNSSTYFSYYLESYKSGVQLLIPQYCSVLLLISGLFVCLQRIPPLVSLGISLSNLFGISYLYYTELFLSNHLFSEKFAYSYSAGLGMYLAMIGYLGMALIAAGNMIHRSQLDRSKELLDSI